MARGGLIFCFLLLGGCAGTSGPKEGDVIFLVPGVDGDGPRYASLKDGLRDAGVKQHIQAVEWGAPRLLFFLNFSNDSIHREAEQKLASQIESWRKDWPDARIDLIGHSAGCGVILGALSRLPVDLRVNHVILLAPSVSPTYSLAPALEHVEGIDVFYSDRDNVFLSWRTGHFGTYDNVKTRAAGNCGFDLSALSEERRAKAIGAGPGATTKELLRRAGRVTSLDYDSSFVSKLAERHKSSGVTVLREPNFDVRFFSVELSGWLVPEAEMDRMINALSE
jgi:pimeloyl-ACP methyl ester carboxylesterase